MSLLASPTGHLTNLSTAPSLDYAPADGTVFDDRVVGRRVATENEDHHTDFPTPGRLRETKGTEVYEGDYTYTRKGPNEGTLVYDYDDGDRCTAELVFHSRTAGTSTYTCDGGESGESDWWVAETPGARGGASGTVYEVDDMIVTMPTGTWSPDRTRMATLISTVHWRSPLSTNEVDRTMSARRCRCRRPAERTGDRAFFRMS